MMLILFVWLYELKSLKTLQTEPSSTEVQNNQNNPYLFILIPVVIIIIAIAVILLCKYFEKNIFDYCCPRKDDDYFIIESSDEDERPSGLKNIKEYCYMNAMIQALASSEKLITECQSIINIFSDKKKCRTIILFTKILKNINIPGDRRSRLQKNTEILKDLMESVKWNKTSQEDTFQLLSSFINGMKEDIKEALVEENIMMPPKFKLLHSFTESSYYNRVQDHLALALPLCGDFRNEPGEKLNTLMDEFFQPSLIDNGPHSTQLFLFERAPEILILHIQANEWDDVRGAYIKPKYYIRYKDKIEYEFNIHMEKDGSKMEKVKVVYNLTAVVHHMGTISGGHYVTYRTLGREWYLTNDEQVEKTRFNFDIVPYVMVYEKEVE